MDHKAACDVLVIGSGAGGLAAAITARHHGLDVIVVEKAAHFGGTTARSGGVLWIPCNPISKAAGVADTLEAARAYLRHECGRRYDEAKVEAYLAAGPEMVDFFTRHSEVRFASVGTFPDYHPGAPGAVGGGRSIQAKAYLRDEFGPELKRHPLLRRLARPLPGATFLGLNVARDELAHFYSALRSGRSLAYVAATLLRHFADLVLHRCSLRAVNGNALAARLGASASALGIPLWLSTPARELLV
ncbi:MAG TPA: FAD-dependent oxidoreductase, partial [Allosphingosinicella sp.]